MNDNRIIIETRDLGTVEIPAESIISFPNGIYAFEDIKAYVALSPLGTETYPMWLQAVENPSLCFIVYNPQLLDESYKPVIQGENSDCLKIENDDEVCFLVIATIPENNIKKATVNLKSPIIVNKTKMLAAQVILEEDYKIRHPLFAESEGD